MQLSTVIDVTVHFMSDLIAAWLSTGTTILWLCILSKSRFLATFEIAKTSARNTVLCIPWWKMLVLGSCLGILHKNPHLLSHLVSSHQRKPWQSSDLERFQIWQHFFIHNLTFEISPKYLSFLYSVSWHVQQSRLFSYKSMPYTAHKFILSGFRRNTCANPYCDAKSFACTLFSLIWHRISLFNHFSWKEVKVIISKDLASK